MSSQPQTHSRVALSVREQARLEELERVVDDGLAMFLKVGRALEEIRDRRLYRKTHDTFGAYCRGKWGIGRHYAYRQINAARVMGLLWNVDNCQQPPRLPANEAQARPLTSLDTGDVQQAWSLALELSDGVQPTSGHVQEAVDILEGEMQASERAEGSDSVHFSSESNDWRSPPALVAEVDEVLGGITLDPCAASGTAPTVPAEHHFTKEQNGLSRSWFGTVYMNPPYGRGIERWIDKLVREYEDGAVMAAIALLPSRTDTVWFRRLRPYLRCFLHGRLTFSGHENPAPFPSMTVYLGHDYASFMRVFSELGDIYTVAEKGDG